MLPLKPAVTIRSSSANVSDLRTRVVRERLRPTGPNTWGVVREVFEAYSEPGEVVALAVDVGEVKLMTERAQGVEAVSVELAKLLIEALGEDPGDYEVKLVDAPSPLDQQEVPRG